MMIPLEELINQVNKFKEQCAVIAATACVDIRADAPGAYTDAELSICQYIADKIRRSSL